MSDRSHFFIGTAVAIAATNALMMGPAFAADAPTTKMGATMTAHCWTATVAYHAINTKGTGVAGRTAAAPQSIIATVCPADGPRNAAAIPVTAGDGSADFGVLPKGRYALGLTLEKAAAAGASLPMVTVTISGADAPSSTSWDFKTNLAKRRGVAGDVNGDGYIMFTSNGRMHSDITISK